MRCQTGEEVNDILGISRSMVGGGLLLILMLGANGIARAQEEQGPSEDAPYQIVEAGRSQLRVDIGRWRSRARHLRVATVLTPNGPVIAHVVRTERICTNDDDARKKDEEYSTCHYDAILRAAQPMREPIVVLSGRRTVSDIASLPPGPERPIGDADVLRDIKIDSDGATYQWTRFPEGVFLSSNMELGRDFYAPPINFATCTQRTIDVFTMVTCAPYTQLLYEGKHAFLASFAEYAEAATQPLYRLRVEGKKAVLVRVGLKGEVVIGMLVRDGDGWRLEIRGADYAILC